MICLKCRRYIVDYSVSKEGCQCYRPEPSSDGKTPDGTPGPAREATPERAMVKAICQHCYRTTIVGFLDDLNRQFASAAPLAAPQDDEREHDPGDVVGMGVILDYVTDRDDLIRYAAGLPPYEDGDGEDFVTCFGQRLDALVTHPGSPASLRAVPSVPAPQTQQCPSCGGQGKWMEVVGEVSREMASDACEPSMEGQPIEQEMTCSFCGGSGVVEVEPAVPAPPSEEPTP